MATQFANLVIERGQDVLTFTFTSIRHPEGHVLQALTSLRALQDTERDLVELKDQDFTLGFDGQRWRAKANNDSASTHPDLETWLTVEQLRHVAHALSHGARFEVAA